MKFPPGWGEHLLERFSVIESDNTNGKEDGLLGKNDFVAAVDKCGVRPPILLIVGLLIKVSSELYTHFNKSYTTRDLHSWTKLMVGK